MVGRQLGTHETWEYEEFDTLCKEISAVLNSRPLSYVSESEVHQFVLTPEHFLTGGMSKYLRNFHETRGDTRESGLRIGRVVLVEKVACSPYFWPLARVLRVFPGVDGIIRSAEIKLGDGTVLVRPVLFFLFFLVDVASKLTTISECDLPLKKHSMRSGINRRSKIKKYLSERRSVSKKGRIVLVKGMMQQEMKVSSQDAEMSLVNEIHCSQSDEKATSKTKRGSLREKNTQRNVLVLENCEHGRNLLCSTLLLLPLVIFFSYGRLFCDVLKKMSAILDFGPFQSCRIGLLLLLPHVLCIWSRCYDLPSGFWIFGPIIGFLRVWSVRPQSDLQERQKRTRFANNYKRISPRKPTSGRFCSFIGDRLLLIVFYPLSFHLRGFLTLRDFYFHPEDLILKKSDLTFQCYYDIMRLLFGNN
uniref:DUF5641 domain-containing protein n=1 Tax=Strigamia maritima TaxID=126957 RepID=T1IJG1_STRMM